MSHFTPQALRARETATLYLIAVRVSAGRLVIESAKPERAPPAEILAKIARVAEGGFPERTLVSHHGTTDSRFAGRGLRCGSGLNRGA